MVTASPPRHQAETPDVARPRTSAFPAAGQPTRTLDGAGRSGGGDLTNVAEAELLARAAGLQISGMEVGNDALWIVPGAGHNQAYRSNPELYVDRVAAFFDRALAPERPAVGPDLGRPT